jgi:hypothetical protein
MSRDLKVVFLNLESGKILKTMEAKFPRIASAAFTQDRKWLVISGFETRNGENRSTEIWDLQKNERVSAFGKDEKMGMGGVISPDKKTMICNLDGVRVWDIATRKQKYSYFTKDDPRLPREKIYFDGSKRVQKEVSWAYVGFLPDGKTFFYVPGDWIRTEIYFHDTATGEPVDYRKRVAALPN